MRAWKEEEIKMKDYIDVKWKVETLKSLAKERKKERKKGILTKTNGRTKERLKNGENEG